MTKETSSNNSNSYDLIIVESPTKAVTIGKYLGSGYKVIASMGHIIDLPKNELGIDLENEFKETLGTIPGKEETIKQIKKMAEAANKIYIASDPDREGEAIAFHIKSILPKNRKDVFRVKFHSVSKDAIVKALEESGEIDINLYEAQKTRRILDRLVGYKVSPFLWDKITTGLSAGRVQSVALRIIVDREDEIRNFKPVKSFSITAFLQKESSNFISKFHGNSKTSKVELNDSNIKVILDDIRDKPFVLNEIIKKDKEIKPQAPFTTSKLQQEANSKLGFSSKQTMQVAQKLYEGKNLKELGTHGLITYMRTDSVRTDDKKIEELRELILTQYGAASLSAEKIMHGEKKKGAKIQDAHEAIRPTNLEFPPDLIRQHLSIEEFQLYDLIWKKFVSSQMASCLQEVTSYWFDVDDKYFFKTNGTVTKELGFKRVYQEVVEDKKEDEEDESGSLPIIDLLEQVSQTKEAESKENWTQPPPRFNESTLIKELEEKGVGRPATYATIISNITDRQYVEKFQNRFKPTELGEVLCKMLVKAFAEQFNVKFTAEVEKKLDLIEEGEETWIKTLTEFWLGLSSQLKLAYNSVESLKPKSLPTGLKCKKCELGKLEYVWKFKLTSLKCNRCDYSNPAKLLEPGKFEFLEVKKEEEKICPKCQGIMRIKTGKFGDFWACLAYPECKHTIQKPKSSGIKCPQCGEGHFIEKLSKAGNIYWACDYFPNCKNIIWNQPVAQKCTECLNPLLERVNGKLKCVKCHKENVELDLTTKS